MEVCLNAAAEQVQQNFTFLYTLSFFANYEMEAQTLEKELRWCNIPVLSITTDYANEDSAQLKTRVEAFLETL